MSTNTVAVDAVKNAPLAVVQIFPVACSGVPRVANTLTLLATLPVPPPVVYIGCADVPIGVNVVNGACPLPGTVVVSNPGTTGCAMSGCANALGINMSAAAATPVRRSDFMLRYSLLQSWFQIHHQTPSQ